MVSLENYSTMDPFILLSAVNMQLRDENPSLEELCKVHDINQDELVKKLKAAGFEYVKEINQFK